MLLLALSLWSGCDGPTDPSCGEELDPSLLAELVVSPGPTAQVEPGGSLPFIVGHWVCCTYIEEVPACVDWSVRPETGARISSDGVLTVEASVAAGARFTVTAVVENGRTSLSSEVYVYTAETMPLVGRYWREEAQLECGSGREVPPERALDEVLFEADGSFSVTWVPFEAYRDYWGSYEADSVSGHLTLRPEDGNYIPTDIDGDGTYTIDAAGRLTLRDIWLGTPRNGTGPRRCGHVLARP
jgi:hypothetical protein